MSAQVVCKASSEGHQDFRAMPAITTRTPDAPYPHISPLQLLLLRVIFMPLREYAPSYAVLIDEPYW